MSGVHKGKPAEKKVPKSSTLDFSRDSLSSAYAGSKDVLHEHRKSIGVALLAVVGITVMGSISLVSSYYIDRHKTDVAISKAPVDSIALDIRTRVISRVLKEGQFIEHMMIGLTSQAMVIDQQLDPTTKQPEQRDLVLHPSSRCPYVDPSFPPGATCYLGESIGQGILRVPTGAVKFTAERKAEDGDNVEYQIVSDVLATDELTQYGVQAQLQRDNK